MAFNIYKLLMILVLISDQVALYGQSIKPISDKHIVNQQQRMVFKQWDQDKFTPSKGFLGLNYQYWLTWGLHPNYPKVDRRPLAISGPQTLRMGFALAMRTSMEQNKLHADTIQQISLSELSHVSPLGSNIDPLWVLYYKDELAPLIDSSSPYDPFKDISAALLSYLKEKGVYSWFQEEFASLRERLEITRQATMERGSRIMAYHRMLQEFKKLQSNLDSKIEYSKKYLHIIQQIPSP